MSSSKVGIVILNYMTYELTIECLNNLNDIEYENFFVVVVDNLSPNNSYEKIHDYISKSRFNYDIYLLKSDKNGGYSYGNNIGIKKAEDLKSDYILIMNNDIVIKENDFLNKLVDYLDKNKSVAMVGPGIIQKKGMIELPLISDRIRPFKYIIGNILYPFKILLNKMLRRKIQSHKKPVKVYAVSGCCFIIRTNVFKEIGYFDDNLFLYGEECILAEKLYQKDYEVYFMPDLCVFHNHSTTIGSIYDSKKIGKMQLKSNKYYLEKYRNDISNKARSMMIYSCYFKEKIYAPLIILIKKALKHFQRLGKRNF